MMKKRTWTQDPTEGKAYYIVTVNVGSGFQPYIHGTYQTLESAREAVDKLTAQRTSYRHVLVIEAKDILRLRACER